MGIRIFRNSVYRAPSSSPAMRNHVFLIFAVLACALGTHGIDGYDLAVTREGVIDPN
jgi:hypothetical protein